MIPSGSRYEQSDKGFANAHSYDIYENSRFEDSTPPNLVFKTFSREATYLVTTLPLPPPPPAEYYAREGEHMPMLAFKFLEDSTLWWRIAEVNPDIWYPLDINAGTYLRLPS